VENVVLQPLFRLAFAGAATVYVAMPRKTLAMRVAIALPASGRVTSISFAFAYKALLVNDGGHLDITL
jgi:hypothetical protein